ncbi:hypothetical protein MRX96_054687 [Rhipicephalus microplus]
MSRCYLPRVVGSITAQLQRHRDIDHVPESGEGPLKSVRRWVLFLIQIALGMAVALKCGRRRKECSRLRFKRVQVMVRNGTSLLLLRELRNDAHLFHKRGSSD